MNLKKEKNSNKYEVILENSKHFTKASKLFHNNGFVILKKIIPKSLVKRIHLELKKIIKNENKISNKLRDIHFFKDVKSSFLKLSLVIDTTFKSFS